MNDRTVCPICSWTLEPPNVPHGPGHHPAIIVDLDGTLCHTGDRDPYAGHPCDSDVLNDLLDITLFHLQRTRGFHVLFLSGRNETARLATEAWLRDTGMGWIKGYPGGPRKTYSGLYLRDPKDSSAAHIYKERVLDTVIRKDFRPVLAFECDPRVAAMFRKRGVPAWLVGDRPIKLTHGS